jgi:O-acetylhomoserine (thiol)-lyase
MKLETLCLHAGHTPDSDTNSRAVPVYRTSSYTFKDSAHARRLFALEELGNIYTRIMNPTQAVLEERIAALEGGAAALALASGTNAIFYSVVNICQAGDEIVSANNLYGGTFTQFNDILPQFGINAHFVDPKPEAFAAAITDKTKLLFCETIGNPGLDIADIAAIADVAHAHGLPLVVDSTFSTPCLERPIAHGADIVVHSLTKWIGGHGTGIGGVVVDSGTFDWTSGKFPLMTEPEASYHDVRWALDLGDLNPIAYILRMRVVPLRNLGGCISPDNAWIFLQGLETLALRMERHCANARATAEYLQAHDAVEWVRYPGLDADAAEQALVEKYLPNGAGAMVVFGIRGGAEAGQAFIESLSLFSHLANVGDAKSLAIHPATTTHSQLTPEQQLAGGIAPELVRLAVGLEHIDDICEDLDQALRAATA